MDVPGIWILFAAGIKSCSLFGSVKTASENHPAVSSVGTVGHFHRKEIGRGVKLALISN
jgi:hypothetical protein